MQPKITTEQLLIIGNGFDLACGLKSRYKDFFNTIPEEKYRDNFWYYILVPSAMNFRKLDSSVICLFLIY